MYNFELNDSLKPGLYCVSTPIGNLGDITFRAIYILNKSDVILSEDTRVSSKLLSRFNINTKLLSNHKFNEKKISNSIIQSISNGERISIISDAGTPIISDPGLIIVKECIKKKIDIFPIPGVSAVSTAMSVSGFDDQYFFYGFLQKKSSLIEKEINKIKDYDVNIVFFVPAVKINFYIKYFKKFFKGRNIFIGREMTKIHETFYRFNLDKFSGLIGLSLISRLFSFKSANNSPVIQFADNLTSDFSITFSKNFDVSKSETKIVAS